MPRVREFEDQTMVLISLYNQNKNMKEKVVVQCPLSKKPMKAIKTLTFVDCYYIFDYLLSFHTLSRYVNTVDFQ